MSELIQGQEPSGVLRRGFRAVVSDYAMAGGWAPDGKLFVVGDAAGTVHALEGTSGNVVWGDPKAHVGSVMDLAVREQGSLVASVGQDGHLVLRRLDDGRLVRSIRVSNAWVERAAWSPGGTHLAVSAGRVVSVFSPEGERVWSSQDLPSTVSAVSWVSDTELATACYGGVTFFDIKAGHESQRLEWKGSLVSLALSPDGAVVACGSQDNSVHFWRRATGQDSMMSGYPSKPSALAFSANGFLLATSGGKDITVWSFHGDGPEGTRPAVLEVHVAPVTALSFAHRKRRLASGGRDSGVVLWDLHKDGSGAAVGAAVACAAIEKVYFRPDDRGLAALDAEGGVTTWRVR